MDTALIYCLIFLANLISTEAVIEPTVSQMEHTTTTSTETTLINTKDDALQHRLDQILVQFCASEIDRNKTTSAILIFGELTDAKVSMKKVVEVYIKNYEESFDNLLSFIDHISSRDQKQIAYKTIVDAIKLDQIKVFDLLSFENFVKTKYLPTGDDDDVISAEQVLTNRIKDRLLAVNVSSSISEKTGRIFKLIPRIVQTVDVTNFTDMDRIFDLSMELPIKNRLQLTHKVLYKMREKAQYQHLFHVILHIRRIIHLVTEPLDKCLFSALENEIPSPWNQLFSVQTRWQIKYVGGYPEGFLIFSKSKNEETLLFLSRTQRNSGWKFYTKGSNSVSAESYDDWRFLCVDQSVPIGVNRMEGCQLNWYLFMSNDLTYVQIKNFITNEVLVVDSIQDIGNIQADRFSTSMSTNCSNCNASKWYLQVESGSYSPSNFNCTNLNLHLDE